MFDRRSRCLSGRYPAPRTVQRVAAGRREETDDRPAGRPVVDRPPSSTRSTRAASPTATATAIGDLAGITSRLDHLERLGVDVVWLSPVYRSPQDDNGYDISDYQDVDPVFGTARRLRRAARRSCTSGACKLVMDLVVNHTSDEHPWFVESRSRHGQPEARLVLVAAARDRVTARRARRRADQLGVVLLRSGVDARRGDRRVLPAPVLAQAARPQLGEPRGPRGRARDDAVVARPGRRRLPHGRHQHHLQGPGAARRPATARRAYGDGSGALRRRPAHPRVPPGDAPRGVRRPATAAS